MIFGKKKLKESEKLPWKDRLDNAINLYKSGDYKNSATPLLECYAEKPDYERALIFAVVAATKSKDALLITNLKNFMIGTKDSYLKFRTLGSITFLTEEYEEAIAYYTKAQSYQALETESYLKYAIALDVLDNYETARNIYLEIIARNEKKFSADACTKLIFLLNKLGEYQLAIEYSHKLRELSGNEEPFHEYLSMLCLGDFKGSWSHNQKRGKTQIFLRHFPNKAIFEDVVASNHKLKSLGIVAEHGVGDEIRFAAIYPDMLKFAEETHITCDPRLVSLFSRSFAPAKFYPVTRGYNFDGNNAVTVPPELVNYFTEQAYKKFLELEHVTLPFIAFSQIRNSQESFTDNRRVYLKPLPELQEKWRKRLAKISSKPKIGVSRGSTIGGFNKEINRTGFKYWQPILNMKDYDFISLQIDLSKEDAKKYGIIRLDDLDLKDDFENVAALMSVLDLVVTPANFVCDLAGAVGAKTIALINSRMHEWRFPEPDCKDLWNTSVIAAKANKVGDRESLIRNAQNKIIEILPVKS